MERIRIITTGGTFDKQYDPIHGELTFTQSQLLSMLSQARCDIDVIWESPLAVDSLYMTEVQRSVAVKSIVDSPEDHVIVIHGTDTMVNTAVKAAGTLGDDNSHVVVFTGAMVPSSLSDSDACFNLGMAMAAVQTLSPGVYIAMSGRIFPWNHAVKNRTRGVFEWAD